MKVSQPKVAFSRASDSRWARKGLRGFLDYRDLGTAAVTNGRFGATVARAYAAQEGSEAAPRHTHTVGFHLLYVLKGWLRTEFEGIGEVVLTAGDCISYEGEIPQTHFSYSPDYEVLQVTMPTEYPTKSA